MLVGIEKGLVVLVLASRTRDTLLKCADAEKLVHALRKAAALLEGAIPPKKLGQVWDIFVESYDGFVAMRFTSSLDGVQKRVPMPTAIALKLADQIEFKMQQAKYKMRFTFNYN